MTIFFFNFKSARGAYYRKYGRSSLIVASRTIVFMPTRCIDGGNNFIKPDFPSDTVIDKKIRLCFITFLPTSSND